MISEAQALADGKTCMFTGEYYECLEEALEKANNHGGGTITLIADTVVSKNGKVPDMCFNSSVTIASKGGGPNRRIFRGALDRKEMLQVTDGTLRFFNVIIDGACEGGAQRAAIRVSDRGYVELRGSVICNNHSNNADNAENQGATAVCCVGAKASLRFDDRCRISNCAGTGTAISAIVTSGGTVINGGVRFEGNTSESGDNPNYKDLTGNTKIQGALLS
jgi:hypothetical protein